jgi:transposase-like protein
MEAEDSRKRRRYSSELKAQILAECDLPGASVAKVALSHGINANIVHGWRKLARESEPVVEVLHPRSIGSSTDVLCTSSANEDRQCHSPTRHELELEG